MKTVNIDVDMNNLPEYVQDVFLDAKESCCFDYELVNIQHFKMVDDNGKVDTEFWDLAFYETSIRDWLYFVKITVQPWNPTPVHKDYITIPMYTMEKILNKVEEIRNGNI